MWIGLMNGCALLRAILRFEQKLEYTEDGHRIWTGARSCGGKGVYKRKKRHKGKKRPNVLYGKFWVGPGKTVSAHVFAAFIAGKIKSLRVPEGMHLDHHCSRGGLCVDCTELKTAKENIELARTRPIRATPPPRPKRVRRKSGNPVNFHQRQKTSLTIAAE
jgi:hypothetical protein